MAMNLLCRSKGSTLDRHIFNMFSTRAKDFDKVFKDEMIMMTINLPDMHFGLAHNFKNYFTRQIEDSAMD